MNVSIFEYFTIKNTVCLIPYYAFSMNLLLLVFVYLGLEKPFLIYHRVKLLCVTVSTISSPVLYSPIQTSNSSYAKYVLTIVVIAQSDIECQQFHCIGSMFLTLQEATPTPIPSILVNSTVRMPIVVKNEENHQNKSSHSDYSKDIELVINVSKNHRVKRGHGISDYLPGIRKNRYGYVLDNSYFVEIN